MNNNLGTLTIKVPVTYQILAAGPIQSGARVVLVSRNFEYWVGMERETDNASEFLEEHKFTDIQKAKKYFCDEVHAFGNLHLWAS